MTKTKKHWTDHIKDNDLIRNGIILVLLIFVLVGLLVMYIKDDLKLEHFQTSLDIAIGIVIGSGLLKLLSKKNIGEEKMNADPFVTGSTAAGALIGAAVGGTIGAVIGGIIGYLAATSKKSF